jgi:hypothetical protein
MSQRELMKVESSSARPNASGVGFQLVDRLRELLLRRVDATQVRHRRDAEFAFDLDDEFDGLAPRRAARSPGHGDVIGAPALELLDRAVERSEALVGLRGEELERKDPPLLLVDLANPHGGHSNSCWH